MIATIIDHCDHDHQTELSNTSKYSQGLEDVAGSANYIQIPSTLNTTSYSSIKMRMELYILIWGIQDGLAGKYLAEDFVIPFWMRRYVDDSLL